MKISRTYSFQSAHLLPNVPPGHKCGRLHGHTYRLVVEIVGPVDPVLGWVIDYAMLDVIVKGLVIDVLDHRYLNDVLPNPTSELVAQWIFDRLAIAFATRDVEISRVSLGENEYSSATVYRPSSGPPAMFDPGASGP